MNSVLFFNDQFFVALMAIRTMSGTTFLKVMVPELGDSHDVSSQDYFKTVVLDSILHQKKEILNHMHVTFNPMIYGEAAIVDGNGSIHLWKGERHDDYSKYRFLINESHLG